MTEYIDIEVIDVKAENEAKAKAEWELHRQAVDKLKDTLKEIRRG